MNFKKIINKLTMNEKLEISKENAVKAYESGCPDVKKVLETIFGKDTFKPKDICDSINGYKDIIKELGHDESKDVIKIDGFESDDIKVLHNIVKRMRAVKFYNQGYILQRGDRRYYPYHTLSSGSGLVFHGSFFNHDDDAHASSAARLSFRKDEYCRDYAKKCMEIEEGIIGL